MTDLLTAAKAIELVEQEGKSYRKAAEVLGVTGNTVSHIINGDLMWSDARYDTVVTSYLAEQKRRKLLAWHSIENKSLVRLEEKLDNPQDKSSLSQLGLLAGLARDKAATLGGDPSIITASLDVKVIANADLLAAKLSQAILESNAIPVDSTPSKSST